MKMIAFMMAFLCAYLCTMGAVAADVVAVEMVKPAVAVSGPAVSASLPEPLKTEVEAVKSVEEVQLTVKDEAFVPPTWLQDALLQAKSIPVVGPYIVKGMQWLGVIVSFITGLFAFLWAVLRSLQGLASAAKLAGLAEKLVALENSKAMYYLKALSAFNAQKKDKPA